MEQDEILVETEEDTEEEQKKRKSWKKIKLLKHFWGKE